MIDIYHGMLICIDCCQFFTDAAADKHTKAVGHVNYGLAIKYDNEVMN